MRRLRLLVTADPELPVPPQLYGGIERVIKLLVDGLQRRGHEVTLVANGQSHVECELVPYGGGRSDEVGSTIRNTWRVLQQARRLRPDVIHSFGRLGYLAPLLPLGVPKVMSYQRAITLSRVRWANWLSRGTLTFTGCSRQLIEPARHIGRWRSIYNAVSLDRMRFTSEVGDEAPLVFLGRLEHIKGPQVAIRVARKTGRRLVLAGNVEPEQEGFFERELRPYVDGSTVRFIGPVDDARKSQLLSGAAALLMPVLWDEPFGIVMAEALACGTPVIGLSRGAVPEVVDDGITGFVCDTEEEMVAAVGRLRSIDRGDCRQAAEDRFSDRVVIEAYESLYLELCETVASSGQFNPSAVS